MSLLEQILRRSQAPVDPEALVETVRRYGPALRIVTVLNDEGRLAGVGILALPVWVMGKVCCQGVLFGTDGTVPGEALIERMKAEARMLGADVLIGATHRKALRGPHAERIAARYGGRIESVNIAFDL